MISLREPLQVLILEFEPKYQKQSGAVIRCIVHDPSPSGTFDQPTWKLKMANGNGRRSR